MTNEAKYYKAEYENLRRKKNKEIAQLRLRHSIFFDKTYKLLKALGMSDKDIMKYYG